MNRLALSIPRENWIDLDHLLVQLDVGSTLLRNIVLVKDCFDRAFGNAKLAVNALFGVDVEHLRPDMKALHRTRAGASA